MQTKIRKQVFYIGFHALCTICTKNTVFFLEYMSVSKKKTLSYNLSELKVKERGIK